MITCWPRGPSAHGPARSCGGISCPTCCLIIVIASLDFPAAVLAMAALSYVGLGAQPLRRSGAPAHRAARSYIVTAPWLVNFPGLAIFITMLGFNLLNQRIRSILDPKSCVGGELARR